MWAPNSGMVAAPRPICPAPLGRCPFALKKEDRTPNSRTRDHLVSDSLIVTPWVIRPTTWLIQGFWV